MDKNFLRIRKKEGKKLACLTAYDYPSARILDEVGLDFLLVGDSLGMVVLGYSDTTGVTMEEMLHHTRAVARGAEKTWVVADLPSGSCITPKMAVKNSKRLIEAGADAVKIEGACLPVIEAILGADIPLVGHLGMLPQSVRKEGGYHIKGKSPDQARGLLAEAIALDQAGISAIVLELVHPSTAAGISRNVRVPTIGIGSGPDCDGQILVLHDVIGLSPWFRPKFAKARADVAAGIQKAAREFQADVIKTKA